MSDRFLNLMFSCTAFTFGCTLLASNLSNLTLLNATYAIPFSNTLAPREMATSSNEAP